MNRITQLHEWLVAEPNDPFLIYALANEYKQTEPQKALIYYNRLLVDFPTYTATYYHLADLLVTLNQKEEAEKIYLHGISICQQQQDRKALAELQSAYQNMLYDDD